MLALICSVALFGKLFTLVLDAGFWIFAMICNHGKNDKNVFVLF